MKKRYIGIIMFFAEYGGLMLFCLGMHYPGEYAIRYVTLYFVVQLVFGHYNTNTVLIWDEAKKLVLSHFCFYLTSILLVPTYLLNAEVLLFNLLPSIVMLVYSMLLAKFVRILLLPSVVDNLLIVGTGDEAVKFEAICNGSRFSLMKVMGFVDVNDEHLLPGTHQVTNPAITKNIYPLKEMAEVIERLKIEQVVIAVPEIERENLNTLNSMLRDKVQKIKFIPLSSALITFDSKVEDYDGVLLVSTMKGQRNVFEKILKRVIDILAGLVGCVLLLPVSICVKIVNIKSGDKDPIFFTQKRIGKNGEPFLMLKYRTMIPHAEKVLEELMLKDEKIKEEYMLNKKLKDDPRITKAGKVLRKMSLDELPQLINVLMGSMSLVGPRPYLLREKEDMGLYYASIVRSKPGITGMWQSHGRSDVGFNDRCMMDEYYYSNWSLWLDCTILIKTVKCVFCGKGAL
ncbi:MAG: exopolysaccharide biosynthesis polyprenyl glycosylphosphotransferase [Longicatena sp.]